MQKLILVLLICMLASCAGSRRKNYVKLHSYLDKETKRLILNGNIFIGMTKTQLLASWGRPTKVNYTTTSKSRREQWIYGNTLFEFRNAYVYLVRDEITAWQSFR